MYVSTEERLEIPSIPAMYTMSMEPQWAERSLTRRGLANRQQVSRKGLLDALAVDVLAEASQTTSYRWTGPDTLNRGNPFTWIEIECVRGAVERIQPDVRLLHCIALRDMLKQVGMHTLETTYLFRNPPAIQRYLKLHPDLVSILLEARQRVQELFGANVEVALEVVKDPEVADLGKLFSYIRTSLPIDDALDRLQQLDDDWFLNQLDRVGDRFNLNLEVV